MIVCQCRAVSDRDIAAAVDGGLRSLGALCRCTGAGTDCGSCVFALKRLMWDHIQGAARHIVGRLEPLSEVFDATEQPANRRAS